MAAPVRYRGLHPQTRFAAAGLLAVAVGIVLGGTAPRALASLATAWESNRSMLPWIAERLFGFLAYLAMTGSVLYGLLLSTKILDAIAHRPVTFTLHQDLASIGLGLAGVHGTLLVLDKSVPFSLAQVAVPGMAPYAPAWVAAGQIAFYFMVVVVGSFYVRQRIGQRAWRALHYLTFFAFLGSTLHGLIAGTDSSQAWAWWIYVLASAAVVFLVTYRITLSATSRRVAPAARAARAGTSPSARDELFPAPINEAERSAADRLATG